MSTATTFDENAFTGLLHAGTHGTFMRLPPMPADAGTLKDQSIDAAFLGFPWDAMCISRTGTNYGPRAIRDASDQFSFYNASYGLDLNDHYKMADCGDVPVVPGSGVTTMDRAEAMVAQILDGGAMPITIGRRPFDHHCLCAGLRQEVQEPGAGSGRHAFRHRARTGRRGTQPLLPDSARGGCRVQSEEYRHRRNVGMDEPEIRAQIHPGSGDHSDHSGRGSGNGRAKGRREGSGGRQ